MTTYVRIGVVACLVLVGQTTEVRAQSAQDGWKVTVAPYVMAAGMNGTAGIGLLQSDVDMSASDVFSNLQFGFMGYVEATKGKWGVGADVIWMALGTSTEKPLPANIDVNQGGFKFVALRQLSPAVALRAGVMINTLQPTIDFKDPINRQFSRNATWVDPLVGIKLRTPDTGGRWGFGLIADVGGFGVGSDVMLDVAPTALVRMTERASIAFGYRWIYINYVADETDTQRRLLYDVTSSGPLVGFVFKF
jgi:hypothetical protein